jgi:hypothetical protein
MGRRMQNIGRLAAALGLTAVCVAPWAVWRFGLVGLEGVWYAAAACFLPGVILAAVSGRFRGSQRVLQLLLVGTALRISVVLATGLLVLAVRPALSSTEFLLALAAFYCVALAVETRQLIAEAASERPAASASLTANASPRQPQAH